jgi:group I intron endonuclease
MEVIGELLKKSGVYKIICQETGKVYIGSSANCCRRFAEHSSDLRNRRGSPRLQNAYLKYGESAFRFEVIEYCDFDVLRKREQYWMDMLRSYDRNIGYNISISSEQPTYERTPEMKAAISAGVRAANLVLSEESRERRRQGSAKVGKANRGATRSEAFKKHRSEYMRQNNPEQKRVLRSDGVVFDSVTDAAVYHHVTRQTMRKWCIGGPVKNTNLRRFTFSFKE